MRILVGCLFHETHCFSPLATTADGFERLSGEKLLTSAKAAGTTLGGIVTRLTALGHTPVPTVSAVAAPGGLVDHDVYRAFLAEMLEFAEHETFDAIALELHGAMATTQCRDVEGDLLNQLRSQVGARVPIAVGLDLHAHVTPAMLTAADICIACKENPHRDVIACGERVATLLDALLNGWLRPVTVMAKARMILPGNAETSAGPLQLMHARAVADIRANPAIADISLYNAYPYGDDVDMGQAAVITCDGDRHRAAVLATEFAETFWRHRREFAIRLPSIDEALKRVAAEPQSRPFLIADMGDRVLAGAPGDSAAILVACLEHQRRLSGAFVITDPEAAAAARNAGVGATLTLTVGGRITPGFPPLTVTGEVIARTDGQFCITGPYKAGTVASFGPSATLRLQGGHKVVLASKPGFSHDPAAFASQGIVLGEHDFAVVKAGYHFKLNFAGLGTPLATASPGISLYAPGVFPWRHAHIWPEHDVDDAPIIEARTFPSLFANGV